MSADNIIYIQEQPHGRWAVWEQSASEEPKRYPSERPDQEEFNTEQEAMSAALDPEWQTEYGVHRLAKLTALEYILHLSYEEISAHFKAGRTIQIEIESEWIDIPPSRYSLHYVKRMISEGNAIRLLADPIAPLPWSKPEHVPGPVCWIRGIGRQAQYLVTFLRESGFCTSEARWGWDEISKFEHSTDRINWKPCVVTE